ncbi:hypothetical protein [Pseudonocardia sp. ICBG601]|uniref:hypothetical protein n=1 Tax=Pseudonocardia sp. ICBG601 TaxID=2846759 RepID=UPI001CF6E860|nr:hypothetical protein [Pseudonocardia sp. ICBG601]
MHRSTSQNSAGRPRIGTVTNTHTPAATSSQPNAATTAPPDRHHHRHTRRTHHHGLAG